MKIYSVQDREFKPYGAVLGDYDCSEIIAALEKTEQPGDAVVYIPSVPELERPAVAKQLEDHVYGGMPIQIGLCNGSNRQLNCLEYHRGSELNICATDAILLVAMVSELEDFTLQTDKVKAFAAPAGTVVQLYETTLHFAPCNGEGRDGFRVGIVLPRDTNTDKPDIRPKSAEDKLLWGRNKWLIAHPDAPEAKQGAFVGLQGVNISL